ncbi:hypothetical protein Enr13x_38710 [Stieleria neptunia]|uniref:Peptidase family M28 n=1 Tax=Stieleria neptunia TaxID=2527979 RepID=A0A518HT40_9BACT|nr:DUF4910 domain-containing protein [Stieleria neptunia]QDV44010.1 hypothetical protein Enr13x_38710 [Stieleria neptunia]
MKLSECPIDFDVEGQQMHRLAAELFPLHRSVTGQAVRSTHEILSRLIPLTVTEVPSGTDVFDWTIPQEWRIRDAFIADADGQRVVDYADSNLHVVNGSRPVNAQLSWDELEPHLHSVPDQPTVIPYRTAFFRDAWGFCVTESQRDQLRRGGPWQVVIDAEYFDGSLTLADSQLGGSSDETVLFHCHTCHPSLANDNLSGLVVATHLIKHLQTRDLRLSYRFVFAPATIGAIAWLAHQPRSSLERIKHGMVLTLLGDSRPFVYKQSRRGNAIIDRLVPRVLYEIGQSHRVQSFSPTGYDERQYGSPGIDLPIGCLSRSVHGEFPEYHTSADNLDFIRPENLGQSLRACIEIVNGLEANVFPINRFPMGEPQLGRRGIFRAFGEQDDRGLFQSAMMWILNLADGEHDLLSIAERSGLPLNVINDAIEIMSTHGLIDTSCISDRERFRRYCDVARFVEGRSPPDHT